LPFGNTSVGLIYFSRPLLCRFDLAVRAISISRRIASEWNGMCGSGFSL